jgi:hypothetical protein
MVISLVGLLAKWYEESKKEERERNKNTFSDLENFKIKKYALIDYTNGELTPYHHEDPETPKSEVSKKVLEKWDIPSLLRDANKDSNKLIDEADKAITKFNCIVDKAIENCPLEKFLKLYPLPKNSKSIPQIHNAIFMEINGDKRGFSIDPDPTSKKNGMLLWGRTQIAHGEKKKLNNLEEIIKNLIADQNIINQVELFKKIKKKLEEREPYIKWQSSYDKMISDFKLHKPMF